MHVVVFIYVVNDCICTYNKDRLRRPGQYVFIICKNQSL